MKEIHFGIVGCGKIFEKHAQAISSTEGARVTAISDLNEDLLASAQKNFSIKTAYSSYKEMLKDSEVEMVTICTPSGLHAKMIEQALQHGKHVLCEKPLTMNVEEVNHVIKLAKENNLHLFEVKQNRYSPTIQILRNAINNNWLGKLLIGNATVRWNRTQEYYDQASWFGSLKMDGGVVLNQAIHHIDLLCWMMGKPISVMAITRTLNHEIEAPDTAMAIIEFENGGLGNLELTTCAAPQNIEGSITIMGDMGTIKVGGKNLDNFDLWEVKDHPKPEVPSATLTNHACLYRDIVQFINSQNPNNLINGEEALKSLQLAEAISKSSELSSKILITE